MNIKPRLPTLTWCDLLQKYPKNSRLLDPRDSGFLPRHLHILHINKYPTPTYHKVAKKSISGRHLYLWIAERFVKLSFGMNPKAQKKTDKIQEAVIAAQNLCQTFYYIWKFRSNVSIKLHNYKLITYIVSYLALKFLISLNDKINKWRSFSDESIEYCIYIPLICLKNFLSDEQIIKIFCNNTLYILV